MISTWIFLISILLIIKIIPNQCKINNDHLLFNSNEFKTLEKLLEQEMNNLYYSHDLPETKDDELFNEDNLEQFNNSIIELFSSPRNHESPTEKFKFQKKLKTKLQNLGYENVIDQLFRVRYLETKNDKDEFQYELGRNIIATLNGRYSEESKQIQRVLLKKIINLRSNKINKKIFNETITDHDLMIIEKNLISKKQDQIVVIGAHYDSVNGNVSGIDDNGSGCMAVLELANRLKNYKYKLNYTIIFAWFDFEEINGLGSMSFVNHFLIPNYLKNQNSSFHSAIILDMLLKINQKNYLHEQQKKTSSFSNIQLNQNSFYQDSLPNNSISIWYRKDTDSSLANQLLNNFNLKNNEIRLLPIPINQDKNRILSSKDRFYFRGDHYSFWSLSSKFTYQLPTVFITNMEQWRENNQNDCYHKECDDLRSLTKDNLIFLNKLISLLQNSLINLE